MEEDKPLLLALVSGDIRDDEEFTDVTLAWEDGLPIEAHKAILVGWSPQTNIPIPWSKLEVCSPIRKLSVPFLGPGFVEESETLESKTKERCKQNVFVWPDFDLTDYWILISNLEAQPLQLGELGRIGSKNIVLCKVFVKGQVGNCWHMHFLWTFLKILAEKSTKFLLYAWR